MGSRLDQFLALHLSDISRTHLQRSIEAGAVLVNNAVAAKNLRLKLGDVVAFDGAALKRSVHPPVEAQDIPLDVVYEDEYLLAVNKPAGLVVHPGSGNRDGTLVNALLFHADRLSDGSGDERPGIVHRLDKDTSGLVLVAKSNHAHELLSATFAERRIEKIYAGIVIGAHPPAHDIIEGALGRRRNDPIRFCVKADGKPAVTEYWLKQYRSCLSVMRFQLHTGRTHQIRVHCAYRGFQIVGDHLYGERDPVSRLGTADRPFASAVIKCFDRQALHAWRLRFEHPFTKKPVELVAPFPADLSAALGLFGVEARAFE